MASQLEGGERTLPRVWRPGDGSPWDVTTLEARERTEQLAPTVPTLHIGVLGGFRVHGLERPISDWQRRTAKSLTKLLAVHPAHALHQEQILDLLWREVDVESAINSFRKALHAARRAFEPTLQPRERSAYFRLADAMLSLNTQHVAIDADHFQELAESALQRRDITAYETALAAYGGELLPEDRYEEWCVERRSFLTELTARLLLGLGELLQQRGAYTESADRFQEVLQIDRAREDVHCRLIRLYAGMGARDRAIRQFHVCEEVLRRELDLAPDAETVALYADVVAGRLPKWSPPSEQEREPSGVHRVVSFVSAEHAVSRPFVGRERELGHLEDLLGQADHGTGRMILVTGEAGVGKTRLVAEFAEKARRLGAAVLSGGSDAYTNHLAHGTLFVALEGYVASRPDAEREELAQRYPALVHFVPSLGMRRPLPPLTDRPGDDNLYLLPTVVRLLTDLARSRPVVLMLGDLHDSHRSTINLLPYLALLGAQRRWLLVGTWRREGVEDRPELQQMVEVMTRERLCLRVDLPRLARSECDQLVRGMLSGASASGELLESVYTRSLGNPLFAGELVRDMTERCELVLDNGSRQPSPTLSDRVPVRVRALVAMMAAPFEESVRRVLALVAAANAQGISLADLRRGAAALDPPVSDMTLFDALDRALKVGILDEHNDAYAFRHPLIRSALYDDLPRHRREQLRSALSGASN